MSKQERRGAWLLSSWYNFPVKYNPWRTSQSFIFYLASVLYTASMIVIFWLNLLTSTPILWGYVVIATLGELYFLVVFFADCLTYWKGHGFTITEESLTFYDDVKKENISIPVESLIEFKYEKKGKIHFVYKKHGRNDFSFEAQVFSKKEQALLDSIIQRINNRDAKVELHK